jgi:hypothetical protein
MRLPLSVSKTNKALSGFTMARRCAVLSLGSSTPLLDEVISNNDEGLGVLVPIPTLCDCMVPLKQLKNKMQRIIFFI